VRYPSFYPPRENAMAYTFQLEGHPATKTVADETAAAVGVSRHLTFGRNLTVAYLIESSIAETCWVPHDCDYDRSCFNCIKLAPKQAKKCTKKCVLPVQPSPGINSSDFNCRNESVEDSFRSK
jgi:hypothetical protein